MEPRAKAVWSTSAPLPGVGSDASAAGRGGDPLADALAQHMLLLDMDGDLSYEDEEAAAAQHQRLQQQAAQTRGPHAAANPAAAAAAPAPAAAEPLPELPPLPAQPPSPVPEGSEGGGCESPCAAGEYQSEPLPLLDADLLRSKHAPLAPTGFTPAEVRATPRQARGQRTAADQSDPTRPAPRRPGSATRSCPSLPDPAPGTQPPAARQRPCTVHPLRIGARACAQACTHQHANAHTHTHTHTHPSRTHIHTHKHTPTHTHTNTPPHSHPQAYVDRQERTVFFAKCAPSASVEAVARVFGAYGEVEEINLFRQW
jgi:hypothetical protein